jgi:hypothetical protein
VYDLRSGCDGGAPGYQTAAEEAAVDGQHDAEM